MSGNSLAFLAAGLAATVGSSMMAGLGNVPSAAVGGGVLAVCFTVSKFLTVDVKPVEPKKKLSKKEKKARRQQAERERQQAQPRSAPAVQDNDAGEPQLSKTQKRRQKQKAKKAAEEKAKKAAAAAAAAEAKKAAKQDKKKKKKGKKKAAPTPAPEPTPEPEEAPKKKKRNKKKKKSAPAPVVEEVEEVESDDGWEVQTSSKSSKQRREQREAKEAKEKAAAGLDGNEEKAPVRAKPEHTTKLNTAQKFFGRIIGPQGSTRQALEAATGATINMPKKEGGGSTKISISGTKAQCEAAKIAIEELCDKGYCSALNKDTTDAGIDIPDPRLIGAIMGKGGCNVKKIQEATGTRINLPKRDSGSTRVTVVGDAEGIRVAMEAIKQLMADGFSSITHESFVKDSVAVPLAMLSGLIGAGGSTVKGLQAAHNTKINIPRGANTPIVTVDIIGELENVQACRRQVQAMLKPAKPIPIPEEWSAEATLRMLNSLW